MEIKYVEKLKGIIKYKKTIIAVIVVVIIFIFVTSNGAGETELVLEKKEHTNSILVSGIVEAVDKADLSFERTGKVQRISKEIGDFVRKGEAIIVLNTDKLLQEEKELESILIEEMTRLDSIESGPRRQDVDIAKVNLQIVKNELKNEIIQSNLAVEKIIGAIKKIVFLDVDKFFSNAEADAPKINLELTVIERQKIQNGRVYFTTLFDKWDSFPMPNDVDEVLELFDIYESDLVAINSELKGWGKIFRDNNLIEIVNVVENIQEKLLSIIGDLIDAKSRLEDKKLKALQSDEEYEKVYDSVTGEELITQRAKVEIAKNRLARTQIDIRKSVLVAPFSGMIGSISAEIGETVLADAV